MGCDSPILDAAACVGCGECVTVCPSGVLSLGDGLVVVAGAGCIGCGQCRAVCPQCALTIAGEDPWAQAYDVIEPTGEQIAPGDCQTGRLVDIMRSRRSCRRYLERPVPGPVIEDLIRAGITAPSGTNSQAWTFTVLATRAAVMSLGQAVAGFFGRINRLAANPLVRKGYALLGRRELEDYYREHYASVAEALAAWERDRTDRLFHGATAVVVVGSRPGASCPAEDALLATGNMLLAAHCLGLGTCLIGYAVEAMRHDKRVKAAAGLPREETVHAVLALGWPAVAYARPAGRRRPLVRYKTA